MEEKMLDSNSLGPIGQKFLEFATARMKGQDKAIRRIAKALDLHSSGLHPANKPIYSVFVVGGAGSGKSLLAELVAEFWFGSRDSLMKISCDEFFQTPISQWDLMEFDYKHLRAISEEARKIMDSHNENAQKRMELIQEHERAKAEGAAKEEMDRLTKDFEEANKKFAETQKVYQPMISSMKSVVVFDHIEDGKPNVQDEIAKILESGLLVRNTEEGPATVSFRNSVIFITCNDYVHSKDDKKSAKLGFNALGLVKNQSGDAKRTYLNRSEEINSHFSPRMLSLIDRVEIFVNYSEETLSQILELLIKDLQTELANRFPIKLKIGDDVKNFIIREGSDHPEHGIRLLKRKFDKYIRGQLAVLKNKGLAKEGDGISVSLKMKEDKSSVIFCLND